MNEMLVCGKCLANANTPVLQVFINFTDDTTYVLVPRSYSALENTRVLDQFTEGTIT